jgi:hypothetical protein
VETWGAGCVLVQEEAGAGILPLILHHPSRLALISQQFVAPLPLSMVLKCAPALTLPALIQACCCGVDGWLLLPSATSPQLGKHAQVEVGSNSGQPSDPAAEAKGPCVPSGSK